MAAPTLYRASDASAPVLTGTAGDLINLLDKCLVNGYGAKVAAGWLRKTAFAGNTTTRAAFQQGAGNSFYLDVNDNGASTGLTGASGKEAAIRGYETMTDVSTGTNPFPTTAQVAAATSNWRKSASADTVPRGWFLIADDRTFILGILDGDVANSYKVYYFGDLYSLKSGDGYRTCITVRTQVNSNGSSGTFGGGFIAVSSSASTGFFIARITAQTGTSLNGGLEITGTTLDTTTLFPAPDNNLYLSRVLVTDAGSLNLRGYLRGVYEIIGPVGLNDGDTFTGTGDFTGRSFVILKGLSAVTANAVALETTAWDTSS